MSLSRYLMATVLAGLSLPISAAHVTQVNRYATVINEPLTAQVNPLKAVQQIHFPQEIKTIGDAVHYWLHHSGFHLAPEGKQSAPLKQVLSAPLPQVDRALGPLGIETGLLVLVGKEDFELITDTIHREVNFQVKGAKA